MTIPVYEQLIIALPAEELDRLAPRYFSKGARSRARKAERNTLLLLLAVDQWGDAATIARNTEVKINRYRTGQWAAIDCGRAEPADPRHKVLHRIMVLSKGGPPGFHSLRRLYGFLSKKNVSAAHRRDV